MKLTITSAIASVVLALALLAVFLAEGSVLAAAQAADSAADVLVAVALVIALVVGRQPADRNHHYGHGQAEPVAALAAAFVAAQLGIEVLHAAINALRGDPLAVLSGWAALVFAAKVVIKTGVAVFAFSHRKDSAALDALAIDARNDVLVGAVALVGYIVINRGYGRIDSYLALAVGALIITSAIALAVRSIHTLMGAAPDDEQLHEFREMARAIDGVIEVEDLRARTSGDGISASLVICVDDNLTVAAAHAIADSVEQALKKNATVTDVEVHVHPVTEAC